MTLHGQVRPQRAIHSIHVATHTHLLKAMWLSWISSVPVHPQNYSSSLFCGSEEQKRNLTHAFCCSSVPWKQTDRLSP